MSDSEQRPGLNQRDVWLESFKAGAVLIVLMALIATFLFYGSNVDPERTAKLAGTIVNMQPYNVSALSGNSSRLNVRLEDGRLIEVLANSPRGFEKGSRVSIVEHHHDNGRITYTLAPEAGPKQPLP